MKKLLACCLSAVLAAAMLSSCGSSEINVYTNITSDIITDFDDSFVLNNNLKGSFKMSETKTSDTQYYNYPFEFPLVMNTDANVVVHAPKQGEGTEKYNPLYDGTFENRVGTILWSINNSLSTTVSSSPISAFNNAAAGATVTLDAVSYEVLTLAKSIYEQTDGYYNPSVYYSVQDYGFGGSSINITSASQLPGDERLKKYTQLYSHFGDIELYEDGDAYYAVKPTATVEIDGVTYSMKIDLGGIGKGYAVDKVKEVYEEYGFEYGYISLGTSSMAVFEHASQGSYTLGLNNPRTQFGDDYITVKINDVCVSTSGDYEQYYEIDGVRYCHIIDPTTGKPVQTGIYTATVIGGSAAEDDAYTTAIMTMGKDKAIKFINEKLTDRLVVFTCNK